MPLFLPWFLPVSTDMPPPTRPPTPPGTDQDSPDALQPARAALIAQVLRQLPGPGLHALPGLPGVSLFRSDALSGEVCGVYEPSVAVILQGRKRVSVGADTLVYDAQHFLITSLDLPAVATLLEASPERPFLALALRLDLREVAGLMLSGALPPGPPDRAGGRAMATGRLTPLLLEAFGRLLALLDRPEDIPVLAPLVQREIFYRLLVGELGPQLRRIAVAGSQGHQVGRAIALLRERFAEPLRVDELARAVRMSPSTFHLHFKALTAMSPLQYQKQLRLAEARRLMLTEHLDAAAAAYRVGYESPSQFSREYSRRFGGPPARDIAGLRGTAPAPLSP